MKEEEQPILPQATLCFLLRGEPPVEVLLGRKKRGFGAGKIDGFGGKVEPGESIPAAARREMREETGVLVRAEDCLPAAVLQFFFPSRPAWSQEVHVFLARRWEGEPCESEEMQPAWFRLEQIPYAEMWADAAYWLPLALAGRQLSASFVFAADNETVSSYTLIDWAPEP